MSSEMGGRSPQDASYGVLGDASGCPKAAADIDRDADVDRADVVILINCISGARVLADVNCAD